jgi:MFS family permease
MFLVGVAPAALVLLMRGRLHEPAKWVERVKAGKAQGIKAGSFGELLTDKRWAKNAWLGLLLAFAGVVGLWGIGFFSVDLNQSIFRKVVGEHAQQLGLDDATKAYFIPGMTMVWSGVGLLTLQIGAFWGMISFSWLAQAIGRKPAFFISFVGALASTVAVFGFVTEVWHLFTLVPLMGFFQLSLFGGYAIYFPELFPTHLRSTGTSFCYNFGRLIAATGPLLLGYLTANVFTKENGYQEGMRQAGMVMSSVFLLGVLVLPWLPETKGKPLPE